MRSQSINQAADLQMDSLQIKRSKQRILFRLPYVSPGEINLASRGFHLAHKNEGVRLRMVTSHDKVDTVCYKIGT